MRIKLKSKSTRVGRVLLVEANKGDELSYVDAERVHRGDLDSFLPFTYERGGKSFQFTYYLGNCLSVEQLLAVPLNPDHFRNCLQSLLRMMQICESTGLSRLRVMHDPKYVFFNPLLQTLMFVYVPLRSYVSPRREADLVARICSSSMVDANDQRFAVALWDFVHRTTIMTSVAFKNFLQNWGLLDPSFSDEKLHEKRLIVGEDNRSRCGWDFVRLQQENEERISEQQRYSAPLLQSDEPPAPAVKSGEAHGQAEKMEGDAARVPPIASEQAANSQSYRLAFVRLSTGKRYVLTKGVFLVGRAPDCAICVSDAISVSRKHASIGYDGVRCVLRDLNSKNGIHVDGRRLAPGVEARLEPGMRFALGDELFQLVEL